MINLFKALIVVFSLFGIFFISLLAHEYYHVLTLKGAGSVCISTNLKINDSLQKGYLLMFTEINTSQYGDEFNDLREENEKIAGILEYILCLSMVFFLGRLFNV